MDAEMAVVMEIVVVAVVSMLAFALWPVVVSIGVAIDGCCGNCSEGGCG